MLKPFAIDKEVRDIHMLSWCVIVETLQALFILVFAFSFVPIRESEIVAGVLPQIKSLFRPEREMSFYRLWVLGALALQAAVVYGYQKGKLSTASWKPRLKAAVIWLGLQAVFVFKYLVHGQPGWARTAFVVTMVLAVAHKIYWTEVGLLWEKVKDFQAWKSCRAARFVGLAPWGFVGLVLFVVLWPSVDVMLVEVFRANAFGAWDEKLLAPAWAMTTNVTAEDVRPSGFLLPALLSSMARWFGGLSYASLSYVVMGLLTLYYGFGLWLLYRIFKSASLAALGIILMLQWELFHQGQAPAFWADVTRTPLTHVWDAGVLLCLWTLTKERRAGVLCAGAVLTGAALAWSMSGMALWAAWIFFMMMQSPKDISRPAAVGYALSPLMLAAAILCGASGKAFWSTDLWQGVVLWFSDGLVSPSGWTWPAWLAQTKQFFYVGWGFVWLSVYVIGLWGIWWRRQQDGPQPLHGWWTGLCVYGIGQWILYAVDPNTAGYTSAAVIMVIIALTIVLRLCGRYAYWAGVGILFFTLTNPLVLSYPFFWRRDIGAHEKMQSSMGMEAAGLIQKHANSADVFLITSFETPMLIQSGKQSAWERRPLIRSTPVEDQAFAGSRLRTRAELSEMLARLDQFPEKPVFVETRLLKGQIHPAYYQHYEFLQELIPYLTKQYVIQDEAGHLTVLKRKPL